MAWFILNWNPDVWTGISDEDWDEYASGAGREDLGADSWSTGSRHSGIEPGDGLFFLRQGRDRGLLALGRAASEILAGPHYNDPSKTAHYVEYEWMDARTIDERIPTEALLDSVPEVHWNQLFGSGVHVPDDAAQMILDLWAGDGPPLWAVGCAHPTEEKSLLYVEGASVAVLTNRYERDPQARADCLAHYGMNCVVCGFDFEARYGDRGAGFIEVHHLTPLADLDGQTEIDPVQDLRPLCSNCHSMIHRGGLISPEELSALLM